MVSYGREERWGGEGEAKMGGGKGKVKAMRRGGEGGRGKRRVIKRMCKRGVKRESR